MGIPLRILYFSLEIGLYRRHMTTCSRIVPRGASSLQRRVGTSEVPVVYDPRGKMSGCWLSFLQLWILSYGLARRSLLAHDIFRGEEPEVKFPMIFMD